MAAQQIALSHEALHLQPPLPSIAINLEPLPHPHAPSPVSPVALDLSHIVEAPNREAIVLAAERVRNGAPD